MTRHTKKTAPTITVVGSFTVDMMMRIPRLPVYGETLLGSSFLQAPGGKGANQAVACARLGANVNYVGVLGMDSMAEAALELFRQEGIGTECLFRTDEAATGVGFVLQFPDGNNVCLTDMAANQHLSADMVDRAASLIEESDAVLTCLEIPTDAALRSMELARKHGVCSILNPAPAIAGIEKLKGHVDVLTPNHVEAAALLNIDPDAATSADAVAIARTLREEGFPAVIITCGEDGAVIADGCGEMRVLGAKVQAVDTTGAGDTFNAALAVAIAEGKPLVEAVMFANCAGALACMKVGCVAAIPYRDEVEERFRSTYSAMN